MKPLPLKPFQPTSAARERGVALIISLILLTLMSIVGMAGVRAISKEERMVSQTYDRSISFQAAESALRDAELWIEQSGRPEPAVAAGCTTMGTAPGVMVCGSLATPTVPRWIDNAFTGWTDATEVDTSGIKIRPQYFVEYLGNNLPCSTSNVAASTCKRYRISARAKASDGRASVVLQSIYATFEP